ncbi:MAG TPA: protein TolR [Alphaproteobacteria bacterium]|nr:protein TolR [Alphaproteobacteria bacterium]
MAIVLSNGKARSKRNRRKKSALMSEINVTPMVDVMLVLLIIFMVTAPLMATGIKVNLPDSNVSQLENKKDDEPLQVLVDKEGQLYIQSTRVEVSNLATKLREVTKENVNAHIYVRADKDASYGNVIRAISLINEAGFSRVGLVTQPKATPTGQK